MTILLKTFNEMPNIFTSNEFNKRAIENGYSAIKIKRKGLSTFLRKYAENECSFSKTWTKKSYLKKIDNDHKSISHTDTINLYKFSSIDEIINFMKSKNFKIMKEVQEWVEL